MAIEKLKVTQKKSIIGQNKKQRAIVAGLGLTKIGKPVVVENTPSFRGMIKKIIHLVDVEEVNV
jgi:large subunit ribosomal protein L30